MLVGVQEGHTVLQTNYVSAFQNRFASEAVLEGGHLSLPNPKVPPTLLFVLAAERLALCDQSRP
jgi:hypothetical protein